MDTYFSGVEEHYSQAHLYETIVQALQQQGVDPGQATVADIGAVDEFHVRGLAASRELATMADLKQGMQVLDVGCGLGGPARMLAVEYGCTVTGIDLTATYVETAQKLSGLVGLQLQTRFVQANALNLPFEPGYFDAVWTQHVQMNVADKVAFYRNIERVLKPGGLFLYYDIFSTGQEGALHFPLPWAATPDTSFLITPPALEYILQEQGLARLAVSPQTEKALQFFDALFQKAKTGTLPAVGLQLLMGATTLPKLRNVQQNIMEGKLVLEMGVWRKSLRN